MPDALTVFSDNEEHINLFLCPLQSRECKLLALHLYSPRGHLHNHASHIRKRDWPARGNTFFLFREDRGGRYLCSVDRTVAQDHDVDIHPNWRSDLYVG